MALLDQLHCALSNLCFLTMKLTSFIIILYYNNIFTPKLQWILDTTIAWQVNIEDLTLKEITYKPSLIWALFEVFLKLHSSLLQLYAFFWNDT
jgi:hypothetical protein